jgi:hypothetical protein
MEMYKLLNDPKTNTAIGVINSAGWSIPFDPANTDYQAYLAWLSFGNVPLPPDEMAGNIVEQQSTQEN